MTWYQAVAVFIPLAVVWNYLRRRQSVPESKDINTVISPLPVSLGLAGYLKALVAWLFLFTRTFAVRPGIYYLGDYAPDAPLLVTGNFYLTLFSLVRQLNDRSVRLLVIDTEGINVWCSSGKGKFSAREIIDKARACSLLTEDKKLELVLPKLSLAGVKLSELKEAGVKAVIGPLRAEDIPEYLDSDKLKNCLQDRVRFDFKQRLFTAVPTAVQFFYNFLGIYVITFGWLDQSIVWITTALAFSYPLLFPYLPGKLFATKGISLSVAAWIPVMVFLLIYRELSISFILFQSAFIAATSILVGLGYTGNSPISNYTLVRREIAKFLPVVVGLYVLALVIYILI